MKYSDLIKKLEKIEVATGVSLVDMSVDIQNAGQGASDADMVRHAVSAASMRAEDAGLDLNSFFDSPIY